MKRMISKLASFMLFSTFLINNISFTPVFAADINLVSGSGCESAWGEWHGEGDYNAYFSQDGSEYTKIDSALIRTDEKGNYRVEPLGLKGGTNCIIKVVPTKDGEENTAEAFTFNVTPESYDHSGYAFFGAANTPGAYLADGTLPSNADVIYINNENKNTVSLYKATGLKNILSAHSKQDRPLVIRIIGKIDAENFTSLDSNKMTESKGTAGLTIEGVGTDSGFYGWGIKIAHASDAEIRNLHFDWNFEDAIEIQDSTRVWVHNNTFTVGHQDNPKEADKDHGDGSCDAKRSDYVTISYNHFKATAKTCLLGASKNDVEETGHYTYHHNFFDGTEQRTPRIRWHDVHVYNNYYKNAGYDLETGSAGGYGIGATCKASIFAENNYFENTYRPLLTSDKIVNGLSNNDGGVIKAFGNIYNNCTGMRDVDRFEAPSKDYKVTPEDYTCTLGGGIYDNFDTSEEFYTDDYILHTAEECREDVMSKAGAEKSITGTVFGNKINGSESGSGGTGDPDIPDVPDKPGVNMDCTYYYDFPSSGSIPLEFGGKDGIGNFFVSSSIISSSGKTGSVTVDGKAYTFDGVGGFANNAAIKFTIDEKAVLNIVSCSGSTTQRKLVVTNSSGKTVGTILSGTSSADIAEALSLDAGSYTITNKGGGEAKLYYIGIKTDSAKETSNENAAIVLKHVIENNLYDKELIDKYDMDNDNIITANDSSLILRGTPINSK
ncbi:MAG: hypothetical protein IJ736_09450 [Firmicutes bacterium]|nr:hypothetical protein [Bacillota bacterium]